MSVKQALAIPLIAWNDPVKAGMPAPARFASNNISEKLFLTIGFPGIKPGRCMRFAVQAAKPWQVLNGPGHPVEINE
jgi:hypothetical protein